MGNYMHRFINHIVTILFLLSPIIADAQNVSLKGSSKSQVEVGEQFQIVYELNAEGSGFRGPDFSGLRVLTGPMTSTSSSIQIVNGQMKRSFNQSYTYIVVAPQEGTLTIAPASINVDGKQFTSNKLTIDVIKSGQNSGKNANAGTQSNSSDGASVGNKDIYLRAITDKREAVIGEQIIVTYRIYTRVPVSSVNVSKLSSFSGFWMKNLLDENAALQQTTERINGNEYVVADIRKVALFPQKSGKLVIDPMELECVAQVQGTADKRRARDPFESFFNDPFFNRNIQNVQKKLVSESLQINVDPLPFKGQSDNFKGAVGQFSMQAVIDKSSMKSNDAVNITYTITPDIRYKLNKLIVDGIELALSSTYTFTDVTSPHTIHATFLELFASNNMKEKLSLSVILPIKSSKSRDFNEYFEKAIKSFQLFTGGGGQYAPDYPISHRFNFE